MGDDMLLKLYILRGLPGTLKSQRAEQLKGENGKVLSSDDYFKRNGKFDYNEQDQDKAHRENEKKAWKAMKRGISPVIIDNTNVRLWYMKSYVEMADELHYTIEIFEQKDNKKCSIEELYRRTGGTIPMDKLQTMRDTFEKYETVDDIRNAKEPWRDHIPKLYLMRGVPGSGRAALAGKIKKKIGGVIINTRTYFTGRDGVYRFRPDLLPKAHEWIIRRAEKAMKDGISPVIIDTTNVLLWHMKPYVQMALQYYYKVIFKEPEGNSEQDATELYSFNAFVFVHVRGSGCARILGNHAGFVKHFNFSLKQKIRLQSARKGNREHGGEVQNGQITMASAEFRGALEMSGLKSD